MDGKDWQRVKQIAGDALELPAAEHAAYLSAALAGVSEAVEREVRRIVDGFGQAGDAFLESVTVDAFGLLAHDAPPPAPGLEGSRIGAYEVVRELGRGGMGTVYLAERRDGGFEQQVAIKVMGGASFHADVRERFDNERRILAALGHPYVARLFDGGVTDDAHPYIVMEHVRGLPIDAYCAARRLGVDERVGLFLRLAEAVQFAHRNLVVHRDLKPANVLVTEDGTPKLLDFGIAKLLGDGAAADGTATRTLQRVLTPAYASPEQIQGRPVTTASDVFSLGVLLYELFAGRRPYQDTASLPELAAAMEAGPPPPSRTCGDPAVARRLRGDLDAIVAKALRAEPDERYPSVEALARDLQDERDGRPVSARRGTWTYSGLRFVRRHRGAVAAAALVVAALLGGTVAARRQAAVAEAQRIRAESVAAVLQRILRAPNASTGAGRGHDVRVVEVLDDARAWLAEDLAGLPGVEAEVRYTLGTTYAALGVLDVAEEELRRCRTLHAALQSTGSLAAVQADGALADVLVQQGRLDEAEPLLRRVLASGDLPEDRDATGVLTAGAHAGLSVVLWLRGDTAAAQAEAELALERLDAVPSPPRAGLLSPDQLRVQILTILGGLCESRGDLDGAAADYEAGLAVLRASPARGDVEVNLLFNLGLLRKVQGRLDDAAAIFTEQRRLAVEQQGADGLYVLIADLHLAHVAVLRGDAGAAGAARIALDGLRGLLGEENGHVARGWTIYGEALMREGDLAAAEDALRRAVALRSATEDHRLGEARSLLGACLRLRGRRDEAEVHLQEGYEILLRSLGADDPRTIAAGGRTLPY